MNLAWGFEQMKHFCTQETTQQSNRSKIWHIRRCSHFNNRLRRRNAALFFICNPCPPQRKRHRQCTKQPTSFGGKHVILRRKSIAGFHHQKENFVTKDKSHRRIENILVASHTHAGNLFHFHFGELTQRCSAIKLRRHRPEGSADAHGDEKTEGINDL